MENKKNILIKQIEAIDNEEVISILQNELDYLSGENDILDVLNPADREELNIMLEEPFGYNTVTFDEFKKATDKWRKNWPTVIDQ